MNYDYKYYYNYFLIKYFFYLFKYIANKYNFVDKPQNLSIHKYNIPTGAGIIFTIVLITFYILLKFNLIFEIENINFPNREYLLFFLF